MKGVRRMQKRIVVRRNLIRSTYLRPDNPSRYEKLDLKILPEVSQTSPLRGEVSDA